MRQKRIRKNILQAEINVVPYIDVMLVLLVVFMATAPLLTEGIFVELPKTGGEIVESKKGKDRIIVSVDKLGKYFYTLNNQTSKALTLSEIQAQVSLQIRKNVQTEVFVKGDKKVVYEKVVILMAALQAAGTPNVGLLTQALDAQP